MTKWLRGVLVLIGIVASAPARGVIGTIDVTPAATLLYPYFEVDTSDPNGVTTLISIQNASASAAVAYVTVWTDLGIPTQSFNVYLTGYDVQVFNLRDLFVRGKIPRTADAGSDPTDTISNKGELSQDINFPGNPADPDDFGYGDNGPMPGLNLPPPDILLDANYRAALLAAHTGRPSTGLYFPASACASVSYGDSIARGYVTVDSVVTLTDVKPTNADAYFPNYNIQDYRNIFFGDFLIVDQTRNLAEGDLAVHIEARRSWVPGEAAVDGAYTFYGGLDGGKARNQREALPTRFVTHWLADSELITWRDGARSPSETGYACGAGSYGAFPMGVAGVQPLDSEENPLSWVGGTAFQYAAQRNRVDENAVPGSTTAKQGWLYVDLNATAAGGSVYTANPLVRQGWLLHRRRPEPPGGQGRFSSMSSAIQLDNATDLTPLPRPAALAGGDR